MRAQKGRRPLIVTRLDARRASSRFVRIAAIPGLLLCLGCSQPDTRAAVGEAEVVIGRARWRGNPVLLTDTPALVIIDVDRRTVRRQLLGDSGAGVSRLWGLAEDQGRLFSISAFDTLVEIDASGAFVEVARLGRAVLNLIDIDPGMAAQLASQPAGAPLLMSVDTAGALTAFPSPARTALGLTPPEEGLLHLLSCSVPPESICWLPGDTSIFASGAHALVPRARLAGLSPPAPAALIAAPERRVLEDAIRNGDDGVTVLRNLPGAGVQRVTRYSLEGHVAFDAAPVEPLRLFVADSRHGLLAIARSGRLVVVE